VPLPSQLTPGAASALKEEEDAAGASREEPASGADSAHTAGEQLEEEDAAGAVEEEPASGADSARIIGELKPAVIAEVPAIRAAAELASEADSALVEEEDASGANAKDPAAGADPAQSPGELVNDVKADSPAKGATAELSSEADTALVEEEETAGAESEEPAIGADSARIMARACGVRAARFARACADRFFGSEVMETQAPFTSPWEQECLGRTNQPSLDPPPWGRRWAARLRRKGCRCPL
jgi:hypothetical protein